MKRNVLIILIIVLILALIFGGLYYFDITKTIVHYNYPNISYKIEESDSSIKYTIYTRIDEKTVKCIREYIFENDKLTFKSISILPRYSTLLSSSIFTPLI